MGSIRILQASAGSGKTFTLAYQYIKSVIENPYSYREILAVTFTNKATEEMKQRIIKQLNSLSSGAKSDYLPMLMQELRLTKAQVIQNSKVAQSLMLHNYSQFAVLTIDKFFQRVIRSFIKELGMDLNFNIELNSAGILESATDNLIEKIAQDQSLRDWIVAYLDEKIEQGSKWNVKDKLAELGKEIFNDHYKQSKLTREQISQIVATLDRTVALAHKKMLSSANTILKLCSDHNLSVDDFKNKASGAMGYVIKISKKNFEAPTARSLNILEGKDSWYSGKTPKNPSLLDIEHSLTEHLGIICDTYLDNHKNFKTHKLIKQNYRNFALLKELSSEIQAIYTKENIMHISETNQILANLIAGNDTPFIFEKVGNVFSQFMIDEFQDTSQKQWNNFIPLLHNALSSSDKEAVLLVGDIKQSIYRWRGGDWRILGYKANEQFKDVTLDNLKTNYRSLRNVVEFNNAMIESITTHDNTTLNETLEGTSLLSYKNMLSDAYKNHSQQYKSELKQGYVNISIYDKEEEGKPLVIKKIEQLQEQGYQPGEIALLVNVNSEAKLLASMLLKYKGENPESKYCYDVVTAEALEIGKSQDVSFIIAVMKLSNDINNLIYRTIINNYLGHNLEQELSEQCHDFILSLSKLSPQESFEQIINYFKLGDNPKELAYIQALHGQIISYSNSNIADNMQFVAWWEKTGATQSINIPQSRSAITITTIHKSKGLEFKSVIIPFCNWRLTPKSRSIFWTQAKDENLEKLGQLPIEWVNDIQESHFSDHYKSEMILSHIDKINTYYVASTRAEDELHIMIPQSKIHSGRISELILSSLNDNFLSSLQGRTYTEGSTTFYSFGETVIPKQTTHSSKACIFKNYPSRDVSARENLRLKTQRYYEPDELEPVLSPRNYGILMHTLFENSNSLEQVIKSSEKMLKDALINKDEFTLLKGMVDKAMQNPTIASWFSGDWDDVKTERDIIQPNNSKVKRPDRVMIKGSKAVVLDYKFGLNISRYHTRQIAEYCSLLKDMGYQETEGYLWYATLGEIIKG